MRAALNERSDPLDETLTLVVTDTTAGLRRDTRQLTDALTAIGVPHRVVGSSYRWTRYLRRGFPIIDLVESFSLRLALRRAGHGNGPVLCATSTSAIMLPSHVLRRAGVRFDALTVQNRPGWKNGVTRALERRWLRKVRAAFPYTETGETLCRDIAGRNDLQIVRFAPFVFRSRVQFTGERRNILIYAADPYKKGLDLAVEAFALAGIGDHKMLVTGLSKFEAQAFLASRHITAPDNVHFLGVLPAEDYRDLARRSLAYLGSSRVDEFATAQLEALADGALLVTCPSSGGHAPYEIAHQLGPDLVAENVSVPALAAALARVMMYDTAAQDAYRAAALKAVEHLSEERFVAQLGAEVLPLLRLR